MAPSFERIECRDCTNRFDLTARETAAEGQKKISLKVGSESILDLNKSIACDSFSKLLLSYCDRVIEIGLRVQFVLVHLLWTAECRWKKFRFLISARAAGLLSVRLMVHRRRRFRIRIRIDGMQDEPMSFFEFGVATTHTIAFPPPRTQTTVSR